MYYPYTLLCFFVTVPTSVDTQFLVQTVQRITMNEIGLVLSVHAMPVPRTFSNHQRWQGVSHLHPLVIRWFGLVKPPRTHVIDLYAHCFLCTEGFENVRGGSPRLNHPEQVYKSRALVRGGSSTSHLLEPSRTTSSQREQGVESFVT